MNNPILGFIRIIFMFIFGGIYLVIQKYNELFSDILFWKYCSFVLLILFVTLLTMVIIEKRRKK